MNPYYHLPPEQGRTQRQVDQYNADARLWKKLEPRRRARRKLLRDIHPPRVQYVRRTKSSYLSIQLIILTNNSSQPCNHQRRK